MKGFKGFFAALLMSAPLMANAYPASWTDTYYNPELITAGETLSWTHDIRDNGFNVGADTVTNYSLGLWLSDDLFDPVRYEQVGRWLWVPVLESEWGSVSQGGSTNTFEVDLLDWVGIAGTISGVASLNSTGLLDVSLTGLSGDFYFGSSTLRASGNATSVPEPSSIALLAAGMIGIVVMRRMSARAA